MIYVDEKDELRFRGEERIVEEPGTLRKFDIKGFDDGDWFEEMPNGETLYRIDVKFRSNRFIYDVLLSSRNSSDCTKFMDDLMMEYVKNIEIFTPLEDIIKDKRYTITYRIEEVDADSENVNSQLLSVVLVDNSYKNRTSIEEESKIHGWQMYPNKYDVIKGWKKLLSAVLDEIDEKKVYENLGVTPEMKKYIDEHYGDCVHPVCNATFTVEEIMNHSSHAEDVVNHPAHYESGKFECIEVMQEVMGIEAVKDFCICNVFKYVYRHKNKNGLEDLKKAKWYLDKYLELS
jgi:hypothetical protein